MEPSAGVWGRVDELPLDCWRIVTLGIPHVNMTTLYYVAELRAKVEKSASLRQSQKLFIQRPVEVGS
jgi:hypothetical protein